MMNIKVGTRKRIRRFLIKCKYTVFKRVMPESAQPRATRLFDSLLVLENTRYLNTKSNERIEKPAMKMFIVFVSLIGLQRVTRFFTQWPPSPNWSFTQGPPDISLRDHPVLLSGTASLSHPVYIGSCRHAYSNDIFWMYWPHLKLIWLPLKNYDSPAPSVGHVYSIEMKIFYKWGI